MDAADIEGDLVNVLFTEEDIQGRLAEMAAQITKDYVGKDLLVVGVLRGAVMVMADLSRHLDRHLEMDWMAVSSYGSGTKSSGVVRILKDLDTDISGRHVLIVDEIKTGVTFVDGLGVGDVHDVALRDRRRLSEDGVLIVVATVAGSEDGAAGPTELIARGFGDGSGELLDELREEADRVLRDLLRNDIVEIKLLQEHLHDELGQMVYDRTHRRPMILPVVVEV